MFKLIFLIKLTDYLEKKRENLLTQRKNLKGNQIKKIISCWGGNKSPLLIAAANSICADKKYKIEFNISNRRKKNELRADIWEL